MLLSYPAIFFKEKIGGYSVVFPDLNHLATDGETLEKTIKNSMEILSFYIYQAQKDGDEIPAPSALKDIDIKKEIDIDDDYKDEDIFINMVNIDTDEYLKKIKNRAIKKTLTIPVWLDNMALENNINFSATLQEALKQKLGVL